MHPWASEKPRKIWAATAILMMLFAIPAHSQAPSEALPCINTAHSPMAVQQAGRGEIPIIGTITSLNPNTGEVGLQVEGTATGEQYIKPSAIRLGIGGPNLGITGGQIYPMPQMQPALTIEQFQQRPAQVLKPLGPLRGDFSLAELTVDQGVIRYPNCIMAQPSQQMTFTGTLTFEGRILKVDGTFFEIGFEGTGDESPSGPGVSRGKGG
jgi:hypothetical protein